mmetsp:Transcript_111989/g.348996  ORF Transcript_111989/g.348996 Transcript_111989/m.348996 type:complete len:255 (-) Transcript_111989:1031-1795(-)
MHRSMLLGGPTPATSADKKLSRPRIAGRPSHALHCGGGRPAAATRRPSLAGPAPGRVIICSCFHSIFRLCTSSSRDRFSLITTAMSRLLANPLRCATPFTSSTAVISLSRSASLHTMANSVSTSLTSSPMEDSQVLTAGSSTIALNSSRSRMPLPSSSAARKRCDIFLVWVMICLCFCVIMMVSSVAETRKVSLRNTPVMTMITAKPMMNLWERQNITYHSETLSVSARAHGIQFARVISNMVSMALLKFPKYM